MRSFGQLLTSRKWKRVTFDAHFPSPLNSDKSKEHLAQDFILNELIHINDFPPRRPQTIVKLRSIELAPLYYNIRAPFDTLSVTSITSSLSGRFTTRNQYADNKPSMKANVAQIALTTKQTQSPICVPVLSSCQRHLKFVNCTCMNCTMSHVAYYNRLSMKAVGLILSNARKLLTHSVDRLFWNWFIDKKWKRFVHAC